MKKLVYVAVVTIFTTSFASCLCDSSKVLGRDENSENPVLVLDTITETPADVEAPAAEETAEE